MSTETDLRDWRGGQIGAERLCAGILTTQGYTDVDPQAPLGGPDDKKDILAKRDGRLFVGAVYFPPTAQTFSSVRKKFEEDREGVERHGASGFVFMVNQPLKLSEREKLRDLGGEVDDIYHLERLRLILDAPLGYGLRLEFLGKLMTAEEQLSFFSALQQDHMSRLLKNSRQVENKLDEILERTVAIGDALGVDLGPSSLGGDVVGPTGHSMGDLTIADLQTFHSAITENAEVPRSVRGALRGVRVWIGDPKQPIYDPPEPDVIVEQLVELLTWWNATYPTLQNGDKQAVVAALARLHYGLVAIHPFLDGNGRVARFVVDQAANETLGRGVSRELTEDHNAYFAALREANSGDLGALERLVAAALE